MKLQKEKTAQVLAALAAQGKPLRCPNWSNENDLRPGEEVLLGCGSTNIEGPDEEGLYDCLDCGIWFLPEAEPLREEHQMKQQRDWRVSSDEILQDLEECHPADRVRMLVLDLAECGQEVHELRRRVEYLTAVIQWRMRGER